MLFRLIIKFKLKMKPQHMYKAVKPRKNAAQPKPAIQKRKRVVLKFVQKEEIIQKLKDDHTAKKLALDYETCLIYKHCFILLR